MTSAAIKVKMVIPAEAGIYQENRMPDQVRHDNLRHVYLPEQ
jgi:hypothetical protein